jgi:hypothetical protein
MEEKTKKDVLSNLGLIKKALEDIENYIKNKVHENGEVIENGINGVIDYIYIILKGIANGQPISYGVILEDAKKKGLEKEFRVAYNILKSAKFIEYDVNNKFIIMGEKTKYLIKQYNEYKIEQKENINVSNNNQKNDIKKDEQKENVNQNKSDYINVSMVNQIYYWVLDEINRNEWVSIDTVKGLFKGYDKEISEAINRIISEGKGQLIDDKIYKKD